VVPAFMYKFVEALGNLTYAIYLLHFPIQISIVLVYAWLGKAIPYYNNVFFISFMLFTLLFSRLVFLKFEMPAQTYFRRKFLKKRPSVKSDVIVAG
jgi:peptidoglycan/LPS O-acetylase OafA/YrhL